MNMSSIEGDIHGLPSQQLHLLSTDKQLLLRLMRILKFITLGKRLLFLVHQIFQTPYRYHIPSGCGLVEILAFKIHDTVRSGSTLQLLSKFENGKWQAPVGHRIKWMICRLVCPVLCFVFGDKQRSWNVGHVASVWSHACMYWVV